MDGIAIHYSVTEMPSDHARCLVVTRGIESYHASIGYRAPLAYNFLICSHGEITSGRGWGTTSGANGTAALNLTYWAVCGMLGPEHTPPPAMLATIARLCDEAPNTPRNVVCHSDLHSTSCPGDALRAWVRAGAVAPGGTPGGGIMPSDTAQEAEMIYVADGRAIAMQGPIIVGDWSGNLNQFGIPQEAQEFSANQVPIRFVHPLVLAKLVKADELAMSPQSVNSGTGPSLAEVKAAVREQLNATHLASG